MVRCMSGCFFSDFSKGFDLVDHYALLHELDNLDVDPHLMRWIAAFLTNRKHWVRVGTVLSKELNWPLSCFVFL